jgi:glucose uptake protein GlcU
MKLVRIPALLALLILSGPLQWEYSLQRMRLNADGITGALPYWMGLVAVAVVFIVVAGAARTERNPGWLLGIEGFLAAVIALVPPLVWAQALGTGPFLDAMGGTTGAVYSQVLAVFWLVTVVRTARGQRAARG